MSDKNKKSNPLRTSHIVSTKPLSYSSTPKPSLPEVITEYTGPRTLSNVGVISLPRTGVGGGLLGFGAYALARILDKSLGLDGSTNDLEVNLKDAPYIGGSAVGAHALTTDTPTSYVVRPLAPALGRIMAAEETDTSDALTEPSDTTSTNSTPVVPNNNNNSNDEDNNETEDQLGTTKTDKKPKRFLNLRDKFKLNSESNYRKIQVPFRYPTGTTFGWNTPIRVARDLATIDAVLNAGNYVTTDNSEWTGPKPYTLRIFGKGLGAVTLTASHFLNPEAAKKDTTTSTGITPPLKPDTSTAAPALTKYVYTPVDSSSMAAYEAARDSAFSEDQFDDD